jgi:hypothetical protein
MIMETGFTVRAREFQPAYLRLGFSCSTASSIRAPATVQHPGWPLKRSP